MVWLPAWIRWCGSGGAVRTNRLIDQPVRTSFRRLTARAAKQDGQMRVDRVALVVVDRSGLQVVT